MAVEITCSGSEKKVSLRRFKRCAGTILKLLNQDGVELSLALVDNEAIQELNARYRNQDGPTDVLSFPSGERLPTGTTLLGDVVISVEQAGIQAKRRGRSLDEEMESLLIHGILHLLGYDHERSKEEAKIMRKMERKIYQALCGRQDLGV